jgi:hypothetical protein
VEYGLNRSRGSCGKNRKPTNVEVLVGGLLELIFLPPLPKFGVEGQVGVMWRCSYYYMFSFFFLFLLT